MRLVDVAGDYPTLCQRLQRVRQQRSWAHAYIFLGDDAPFLERFALAWAQTCACQAPTPEGDACGTCPTCHAFSAGSYPELFQLRAESKSRQILIGDLDKPTPRGVRHLIAELSLTAAAGFLKIGLIPEADRMTDQAQNAFLKTLEEPAGDRLLLLTSTQAQRLLPTVRSRCQIIQLLLNRRTFPVAMELGLCPALARLRAGAGAAVALAGTHALLSMFSALRQRADAATEQTVNLVLQQQAADDKALRKQLEDEQGVAAEAEYRRLRQGLLDALYTWFELQLLLAAGVPRAQVPNPEFLDAAGAATEPLSWDEAERSCRLAGDLVYQLAGNMDDRLAVEAFCLAACERSRPLPGAPAKPAPTPLA